MLNDFLNAIDLPKSRIIDYPRYIFLCGGPVPSAAGAVPRLPPSLRYSLLQKITSDHPDLRQNILLAETVFERFEKDHYGDLLTFERYPANFCSAIVVILESSGAIAEFGAFVLLKEVVDKLYAVIDSSHYESPSFIRKGPIAYLAQRDEKQVISHNWLTVDGKRPSVPKLRIFSSDLIDEIIEIHQSYSSSHKVDLSSPAHHMLLLASLLYIAQPLKISEIVQCAQGISSTITNTEVHKYLSMLQSLGIIEKNRYGHIDYYANIKGLNFVDWTFQIGVTRRDIPRWIMDFRIFFGKNDKKRMTALKNWPKVRP